jgi:hypothetical protein
LKDGIINGQNVKISDLSENFQDLPDVKAQNLIAYDLVESKKVKKCSPNEFHVIDKKGKGHLIRIVQNSAKSNNKVEVRAICTCNRSTKHECVHVRAVR